MARVHVNIGSNLGNREDNVSLAAEALMRALSVTRYDRAPLEYSTAWGYDSLNDFVNLGIMFDSDASPREILAACRAVESSISPAPHRRPDGSYIDRMIDIDLIAVGDFIIVSPDLILPHPRMHLRQFVLRPISILDPSWRHPSLGLTAEELEGRAGD